MTDNDLEIPKLSSDQEKTLEKNIVWIFSSPRSGTAWLGRELLSFKTYLLPEPLFGAHVALPGARENNRKLMNYQLRREYYFFNEKYQKTWNFYLRKLILNRIYAQFADLSKKIIIKEPNGSHGAKILTNCLPNSKIIVIRRDGRDVVDSSIDANWEGSWFNTKAGTLGINERTKMSKMRKAAKNWKIRTIALNDLYKNYPKDLRYRIKYEDLLKNTFDEVQKIYKFMGISISAKKLKALVEKYKFENIPEIKKGPGKPKRYAKPGLWKQKFSKQEQEVLLEIMGDTLKNNGYL